MSPRIRFFSRLFLTLCACFTAVSAPAQSIKVTLPDGTWDTNYGRGWNPGAFPARPVSVTWTSTGVSNVRIDLYKGGVYLLTMAASVPASNRSFSSYTITNTHPVGGDFRVRISAVENPAVYDESDTDFSISSNSSDTSMALRAQTGPSSITLDWSPYANPYNEDRTVSRREMTPLGPPWPTAVSLGTDATSHTDTSVTPGVIYEYRVLRTSYAEGYIAAGINVPLVEKRGTVLLLVDETMATPLAAELTAYTRDLVGDGWEVVRRDVLRKSVTETGWKEAVAATKAIVVAEKSAHPDLRSVFLIGNVAAPYSGNIAPDGHAEHTGAWPADGYYGELDGTMTDATVNNTQATDARNDNIPGDGKFDQKAFLSPVDLEVGRIDFRNMSSFVQGETALLRNYFAKNRLYRFAQTPVEPRVLVEENFTPSYAESAYRAGTFFGGDASVDRAEWFDTLGTRAYLFAFGNGPGTGYTNAQNLGTTTDFATRPSRAIFNSVFGSYFGDWDSTNNIMRAAIAGSGGLVSFWGARPDWMLHPMGMGETIGYATRYTMNFDWEYYASGAWGAWNVHIALLGDPTLRLHMVAPPSVLQTSGTSTRVLTWIASPDPGVIGYHVYRAPQVLGPYTRISGVATGVNPSGSPVTATTFTDNAPISGGIYMVRAVKNETGFVPGSGNYFNQSQGIFSDEGDNTRIWDGGGSDNLWSSAANWSTDTAPATGQAVVFGGTTRLNPQNTLSAGSTVAGIAFTNTAGAFVLSGNAITLTGNVLNQSAANQTITLPMALGAEVRFDAVAGGNMTVSGALSSSGGIIKGGTHTLILSGNNSYSGRTSIEDGLVRLGDTLSSGGLQMSGGAALDLNGNNATFTASTASGGHLGTIGTSITDNGAGTGTTLLTINNNAQQPSGLAALIADGPTRKIGLSMINNSYYVQLLTNAKNTFSGGTLVSGGSGSGSRLYVSTLTNTLSGGKLVSSHLGIGPITLGTAANLKGQIHFYNAAGVDANFYHDIVFNTTLGADLPGGVRLSKIGMVFHGKQNANLANASFIGNGGVSCTITGQITGAQGLQMMPTGATLTMTLANTGPNPNDYAGDTILYRAVSASDLSTLQLGASHQIPDGPGKGNVNAVGQLRLNGFNETINGLNNAGDPAQPVASNPAFSVVENNSATTASTLTLGAGNATGSYTGVIRNGSSAVLHIAKTGTGTQTLSGNNSYTGSTSVNQGTLVLTQATLANAATVSIASSGAVLQLNHGAQDTVGSFYLGATQKWKGTWGPVGSSARYQTTALAGSGTLLVSTGPEPGYEGWAWEKGLSALPPADSGPDGDPERDGASNLLEWALGLSPLDPDHPSFTLSLQSGQLEFVYERAKEAVSAGVVYSVEWSTTLAPESWSTSGVVTQTLSDDGVTQSVKATIPAASDRMFVRVRAALP